VVFLKLIFFHVIKLTTSINVNDLCVNSDSIFRSDMKGELIMNMKKILVVGANKCCVIWMNSVNFL
jgi:hypothetical protein